VARSDADRPYGSFRRPFEEVVEAPPTPRIGWRGRWQRLLVRTRTAQLIAIGALLVLLTAQIAGLNTRQGQLTQAYVAEAIRQALASATPKPNVAIAAFGAIKESVVLVKTRAAGERTLQARGSAILLDSGNTAMTSLHLVQDAVEIMVVFFDGEESPAVLGAKDREFDVALLDIALGSGRKPAVLATAKDLRIGDEAFLVGAPLGMSNSLTVGTISRLGSTFQPAEQGDRSRSYGGLIQFSAPMYPGNSGGALVNRRGEVIGIVTWTGSSSGISGVGFAVPIDAAASAAGSNPF
jgi:S1-C subfamily serine protease